MHLKVMIAVALSYACVASAQAPAQNPKTGSTALEAELAQQDVVFFLVDSSGSISKDDYLAVETKVKTYIDKMPASSLASISFFGSKPRTVSSQRGCDELISIEPLTAAGNLVLDFPPQGGTDEYTAIGKALEAALNASQANTRGKVSVVLFTDGKEECRADFFSIRKKYPSANISVIPVPEGKNIALELLQTPTAHIVTPPRSAQLGPLVEFPIKIVQNNIGANSESDRAWADAEWIEKYLWLLTYCLVAFSAAAFGLRYNQMSVQTQHKIAEWQTYLREQLNPNLPDLSKPKVPPHLPEKAIKASAAKWKAASIGLLVLAAPLVLSLGLSDGLSDLCVKVGFSLITGLTLLWLALQSRQESKALRDSTLVQDLLLPRSIGLRWLLAAACIALLALIWVFIDFTDARSAAWFSLSSNFSTALAVVGASPFVFLGARWFESKRALATLQLIESQSLSADAQQKRDAERRAKEERLKYKIQLDKLYFSNASWGLGNLPRVLDVVSGRKAQALENGVKVFAQRALQSQPDEDAAKILRSLAEAPTPSAFLQIVASLPDIDEVHKGHLTVLIASIASRNTTQIRDGIEKLAKYYSETAPRKGVTA